MSDPVMVMGLEMGFPLEDVAHVIQVALTPIFLLSGIGSLLNVINARISRVADQADALHRQMKDGADAEVYQRLVRLRRRFQTLSAARACGAAAGVFICAATFALFLGALQNSRVATALFVLFGASVLGTMASLAGYFIEGLQAWPRDLPRFEEDQ